MVWGKSNFLTETNMWAVLRMVSQMAMGNTIGKMEVYIKVKIELIIGFFMDGMRHGHGVW